MVVHHQRPLRLGVAERLQRVGGVDGVVIGGEERIVVTVGDRFAGDFGAGNDRNAVVFRRLLRQFHGEIQIGLDAAFVGRFVDYAVVDGLRTFGDVPFQEIEHLAFVTAVLHVFGDRQYVQTVVPRFADAEFGRAVAVRIDRMGVQVGFVDGVAVYLGQHELGALRSDAKGVAGDVGVVGVDVVVLRGRSESRRQGGADDEQFFHDGVVSSCVTQSYYKKVKCGKI